MAVKKASRLTSVLPLSDHLTLSKNASETFDSFRQIQCGFWSSAGELTLVLLLSEDVPELLETDCRDLFSKLIGWTKAGPGRLVYFSKLLQSSVAEGTFVDFRFFTLQTKTGQVLGTIAMNSVLAAKWLRRLSRRQITEDVAILDAEAAVPALRRDAWSRKILPEHFDHDQFSFRSIPTTLSGVQLLPDESPAAWRACFVPGDDAPVFLIRMIPRKGKLPSPGWQNILFHVVSQSGVEKILPLQDLPSAKVFDKLAGWNYRVEAGPRSSNEAALAAWDVQVLPSRRILSRWSGLEGEPWESTAFLRWFAPAREAAALPEACTVSELLGRLGARDARVLVQNFLTTLPGGIRAAVAYLYYKEKVPLDAGWKPMEKVLPAPGLSEAFLRALLSAGARRELDYGRRHGPVYDRPTWQARQVDVLRLLDQSIAEGLIEWSPEGIELWCIFWRDGERKRLEGELRAFKETPPWDRLLSGDPRIVEEILRRMDVTDVALCLREVKDSRWRRHVTANREAEIREEFVFCDALETRGELTVERQIEAWKELQRWEDTLGSEVQKNNRD